MQQRAAVAAVGPERLAFFGLRLLAQVAAQVADTLEQQLPTQLHHFGALLHLAQVNGRQRTVGIKPGRGPIRTGQGTFIAIAHHHGAGGDVRARGAAVVLLGAAQQAQPRAGRAPQRVTDATTAAHPGADATATGLGAGFVLDVDNGQAAGIQAVLRGIGSTADHAAFQVCVAAYGDVEATATGNDAALFLHAAQVALDLLLAEVDGAAAAIHEGAASLGLLAGVVVGVLLADDGQVAADAGHHLVAAQLGTLQRGVLAADDGQVAVGVHHGFDVRGAVAAALALGGASRYVPAGLRTDAETDLTAAALVLRRLRVVFRFAAQGDVVPRGQRHVVCRGIKTG